MNDSMHIIISVVLIHNFNSIPFSKSIQNHYGSDNTKRQPSKWSSIVDDRGRHKVHVTWTSLPEWGITRTVAAAAAHKKRFAAMETYTEWGQWGSNASAMDRIWH